MARFYLCTNGTIVSLISLVPVAMLVVPGTRRSPFENLPGADSGRRCQRARTARPDPAQCLPRPPCSPSALIRHSAGSRGSRLGSRQHTQPGRTGSQPCSCPIHHARWRQPTLRKTVPQAPGASARAAIAFARCPLQLAAVSFASSHRPSSGDAFRVGTLATTPFGPGIWG